MTTQGVTNQIGLPGQVDGQPWWRSAVVYQIYPRSFLDTTGNGVGDLRGVISRLDYLQWLGVDAIWLSPIFPSPMADHGYDVSDYCDIDPLFGDLETFDELVVEAHDRGIRVILDWVPNHSSDQHRWFIESRSSSDNPKRDWYIWREGDPETPPNNWQAEFPEGPAWAWDETSQAWYLHLFTPQQPDLNWANPKVREAMYQTLRFWLDRGVDGFRMDVIHLIGKPEGLPDRETGPGRVVRENDVEVTHEYLKEIRRLLDGYPQTPTSVGEVALFDPALAVRYYGNDDELHMSFNFAALAAPWDPEAWRDQIRRAQEALEPAEAWPTWVLSNHDITRHRQRYGGGETEARAAAVLLLMLRGTPFLYAGEELGLLDADVPEHQRQDPGGWRDGCRALIPWEASSTQGWVHSDNWLPFPADADGHSAEVLRKDPESITNLYRDLIELRRAEPSLRLGDQYLREDLPSQVVGWERTDSDSRFLVVINMTSGGIDLDLEDGWDFIIGTTQETGFWRGVLEAHTAAVFRNSD